MKDPTNKIEELTAFLSNPSYRIESVSAATYTLVRPENPPVVAKVVRHDSERIEIEFSDPGDPPYRRRLILEGADLGGLTENHNLWVIKSARRITWDGEDILLTKSNSAVYLGRGRWTGVGTL